MRSPRLLGAPPPSMTQKLWWLWVALHQQEAPKAMVTTRGQDFGGSGGGGDRFHSKQRKFQGW